jgi:hypothetical protein
MRTRSLLLALIVFSSLTLWAADTITRLNLKEGLWEMTSTHTMTGMPPSLPTLSPRCLRSSALASKPR